ncbi:hypothetical protein COOONC_07562 [Cooperia oncophora]
MPQTQAMMVKVATLCNRHAFILTPTVTRYGGWFSEINVLVQTLRCANAFMGESLVLVLETLRISTWIGLSWSSSNNGVSLFEISNDLRIPFTEGDDGSLITLTKRYRYTPTNNIYGYDYNSSPSSSSDAARLVLNPNYAYLNDALSEGYAKNYVQAEMAYSQGGQVGGQDYQALRRCSCAISHFEQRPAADAQNYQQIRQTYTTVNTFTSSTPVQAPYQSVVDLKTTRLRDPSTLVYYSDVPSTSNAAAMNATSGQSYTGNTVQTYTGDTIRAQYKIPTGVITM